MKRVLSTILFLLTIHLSQAQVKLNHIAVYVENLEQSKSFYSNIIGLQEIDEPFKDGLHVWFKLGMSQLHLIEGDWEKPSMNKNNHLCFSIEDMEGFIQNLKAEEVSFENWPGESGKITKRVDGVKQVYFQDPNGYWIEVNNDF